MSSGLSVALPLTLSEIYGAYNLNANYAALAQQNLKMLVLTSPGERIMDPLFGVGIRRFFFEFNGQTTYDAISTAISQQVAKYLPYISINQLVFKMPENNPDLYPHSLSVSIKYGITSIRRVGMLQINVNNN